MSGGEQNRLYTSVPYNSYSKANTSYGLMTEWVRHNMSPTSPEHPAESMTEELRNKIEHIRRRISFRYPQSGIPREREGGVGGSWRHIKEVLGSSGCRFVFIEGLVRIKDNEKKGEITKLPPLQQKATRHAPSEKDIKTFKKADQLQLQKVLYDNRQSAKF